MALIKKYEDQAITANTVGATFENEIGDLLVFITTLNGPRTVVSATAGWTDGAGLVQSGNARGVIYWKIATAANESFVVTWNNGSLNRVSTFVITDFNPLDPIATIETGSFSGVNSMSIPEVTLSEQNNLSLVAIQKLVTADIYPARLGDIQGLGTNNRAQIVFFKTSLGNMPQVDIDLGVSDSIIFIQVIVNDDGNGNLPEVIYNFGEFINPEGQVGDVHYYPISSYENLSAIIPTTILGIDVVATNLAVTTPAPGVGTPAGIFQSATTVTVPTSPVADPRWIGFTYELNAVTDFSNRLHCFTWDITTPLSRSGEYGKCIYYEDTSGNWQLIQVMNPNIVFTEPKTTVIDLSTRERLTGSVTPVDITSITRIGVCYHMIFRATPATLTVRYYFNLLLNSISYSGGTVESPLTISKFRNLLGAYGVQYYDQTQGEGQFILRYGLRIGNASTKTIFDSSFSSIETPLNPVGFDSVLTDIRRQVWLGGDGSCDIEINASAEDLIRMSSSILSANQMQMFEVLSTSSPDADYGFNGTLFRNFQVTLRDFIEVNGSTFKNCFTIFQNGATLDGCFIEESESSSAIVSYDTTGIKNCDFISKNNHAVEITATGTFPFTGNTFIGYGADDTTSAMIYNNSGGLVTLQVGSTDQTLTVRNSAGSTTVIEQEALVQKVVLTGGLNGSRVQIYDLTSNTELVNEIVSFPYTWEDPSPYVADRQIRLRVAYQDELTAKLFIDQVIGTATNSNPVINFLVNQEDDQVYITNAIDGELVTGIDIDDDSLLVNIDSSSISWSQIYAYETYWLFTEDGIRDEGRFIQAIDPANYILFDFMIKNINTAPLAITNGWGRDSVTGQTVTLIDTSGGPIFSNPDIVIAFATGSGLSSAQDATLNKLNTLTEDVSGLRFTAKALEEAPSSGGGSAPTEEEIYTYFTTSGRQDTFKADVSGLATQASVDAIGEPLQEADYVAPNNADIAAIKAKTDILENTDLSGVEADLSDIKKNTNLIPAAL